MAAINSEYKEPSYGNWRVPRSAGLGNLGAIGTAIVMVGLLLGIVSFAIWGLFAGLLTFALWVVTIIFCIQGFVKAKDGQSYRYPFALRLIK